MTAIDGVHIGREVCEALGLDPTRVSALKLKIAAGEAVRVEVEQLVDEGEALCAITVMKRYRLVEDEQ